MREHQSTANKAMQEIVKTFAKCFVHMEHFQKSKVGTHDAGNHPPDIPTNHQETRETEMAARSIHYQQSVVALVSRRCWFGLH